METGLTMAEIIKKSAEILKEEPRIFFAYLFGSYAVGKANRHSDADIAVYFNPELDKMERFNLRLKISDLLSDALGIEVDIVDVATAPVSLQHRVLRQKQLIMEREPKQRVSFEVASRREYFDLQRHLERRTDVLINGVGEGAAHYG